MKTKVIRKQDKGKITYKLIGNEDTKIPVIVGTFNQDGLDAVSINMKTIQELFEKETK